MAEQSFKLDIQAGIPSGRLVDCGKNPHRANCVEVLSNRYSVRSRDTVFKVKERIDHPPQPLLVVGFVEDWNREPDGPERLSLLSAAQELLAADSRTEEARWIRADELRVGTHVLDVNSDGWAELTSVKPCPWPQHNEKPVHELVLVDGDRFLCNGLILRARTVESKVVKKRQINRIKDLTAINFVPQPSSLSTQSAEVWFRSNAALLPLCIDHALSPRAMLEAMLIVKNRLLDVAVMAMVGKKEIEKEFRMRHRVPSIADLVQPSSSNHELAASMALLTQPGKQWFSIDAGGTKASVVVDYSKSPAEAWGFNGHTWHQVAMPSNAI
jgi:hypothetical protein